MESRLAGVYTPILAFIFSWRRKKISNLRLGRRLLIVYLQDNDNLLSKIVVFLVEARKGTMEACLLGKGEKQPSNKDKTDDNNTSEFDYFSVPNTLPITFFPCVNPAYSYCFGGKQTLKDLYFVKQKCGASQ